MPWLCIHCVIQWCWIRGPMQAILLTTIASLTTPLLHPKLNHQRILQVERKAVSLPPYYHWICLMISLPQTTIACCLPSHHRPKNIAKMFLRGLELTKKAFQQHQFVRWSNTSPLRLHFFDQELSTKSFSEIQGVIFSQIRAYASQKRAGKRAAAQHYLAATLVFTKASSPNSSFSLT